MGHPTGVELAELLSRLDRVVRRMGRWAARARSDGQRQKLQDAHDTCAAAFKVIATMAAEVADEATRTGPGLGPLVDDSGALSLTAVDVDGEPPDPLG